MKRKTRHQEMKCPHCLHPIGEHQTVQELQFELCSRCGTLWLDFGAARPRLHRAVEAQAARWENDQHQQRPQAKAG